MNIVTFYFSGTGNTEWVVKEFCKILTANNNTTYMYSIENFCFDEKTEDIISQSDYVGFAYPIYLQNMPRIMRRFITDFESFTLENGIGSKKIFFINTYGYINAYGVFRANKLLRLNVNKTISYVNIKLPDNTKQIGSSVEIVGKAMPDIYKDSASKVLNILVNKLKQGKRYICGIGPHLFIGLILSKFFGHIVNDNYKTMNIDMDKCIKCMRCVRNCPVDCIKYTDNQFIFAETCEACIRCICQCPTNAITNKMEKTK